jgi:hypothetical protein
VAHRDTVEHLTPGAAGEHADDTAAHLLRALIEQPLASAGQPPGAPAGCTVARLLGLAEDGTTALVVHAAFGDAAARRACSIVELHGGHIGRDVLLGFLDNDLQRPVVLGVLTGQAALPAAPSPGHVEIDADGQRVVVSARHELVLRCGKSHLVLASDGRVELRGETIVTHASRANRVRGGSVELN